MPLTSKDASVKFVFLQQHREAWEALKAMAEAKLLNTHLDKSKQLFMVTDASGGDSICAQLFQCDAKALVGGTIPEPEECQMVSCFSRALKAVETRYHVIEKEMLAVTFACKKFRHFVLGVAGIPRCLVSSARPMLRTRGSRASRCELQSLTSVSAM